MPLFIVRTSWFYLGLDSPNVDQVWSGNCHEMSHFKLFISDMYISSDTRGNIVNIFSIILRNM